MHWRRRWYATHRWLGLIVSLQLLAWSVSGFTFTILDIENVRGNVDKNKAQPTAIQIKRVSLTPAKALAIATSSGLSQSDVVEIRLRKRCDRTVYECFDGQGRPLGAVDATSGEFIAVITSQEAQTVALEDFAPDATVASIELLEGDPPMEYRGGAMPVYRVVLDHPQEPHLYISPVTGKVLKRRNQPWRLFDFLWMLHIMDYGKRENFNHWLLSAMSLLAILTSASGLALWWWRRPCRRRKSIPVVSCIAGLLMTGSAFGQQRDLRSDALKFNMRHKTQHYALAGTVSDAKLKDFGQVLEYIHRAYARGFSELIKKADEGKPSDGAGEPSEDWRFKVTIFETAAQYQEFGQAYFGERAEHTAGMYVPAVKLLMISAAGSKEKTHRVLFHEAFHQFMHRHIPYAPLWVNEGLATYYGAARATRRGLAFDQRDDGYFRIVREVASARQLIPLHKLIISDPSEFYSHLGIDDIPYDWATVSYAQSYTLCAYMLSEPNARQHLRKYLRALAEAESTEEATLITRRHYTGGLLAAMIGKWLKFVHS